MTQMRRGILLALTKEEEEKIDQEVKETQKETRRLAVEYFIPALKAGTMKIITHGHFYDDKSFIYPSPEAIAKDKYVTMWWERRIGRLCRIFDSEGFMMSYQLKRIKECLENPGELRDITYIEGGCEGCMQHGLNIYFDGINFEIKPNPRMTDSKSKWRNPQLECPYPDGVKEVVVEIDIPSGKFLVGNDLREFFPNDEYGAGPIKTEELGIQGINCELGTKLYSEAYARVFGVANFDVGNPGSVDYFRLPNDPNLYVGKHEAYEDTDDPVEQERRKRFEGAVKLHATDTALWWWMGTDLENAKKHGFCEKKHAKMFKEYNGWKILDVEAGRYRFTHRHLDLRGRDVEPPCICTTIEKIE
jgi:hypothetical protein